MSQSPQQQQQQSTMDVDTMLDVYILDYLAKRKLIASAKVFEDEAKVPLNVRAIDAPRGFLCEWWTVFWDIFISRYKSHQGSMESCSESTRVLQLLQQQQQQESQHQSQTVNVNSAINVKNPWIAEASTPMKQQVPKQWYGDNVGVVMNHNSSLNHLPIDHQKHALVPTHDINSFMNSFNPNTQGLEGLPNGAHAVTGVVTDMLLKGWPVGRDQIQARAHHQQGAPLPPQRSYQGQTESQFHPSNEKKRKPPLMPSTVANSSRAGNAVGVFSSSAGEVSMPNSPHNDKINIDDFLNYGALDGNDNNSLLSHAVKEPNVDPSNGFTFLEVGSVHATTSVNCCDISFDGKLVAIGGQDKKATLWCTSTRETKATLDGHSQAITDIRFSPSMLQLATSSNDNTIRIWDLENPGNSVNTFTGHTASVTSLDFHPKKDLICSCDESEIRYWTIKNAGCVKVAKGGANQVRFQSGVGKHLAAIVGKSVTLLDLENLHARKHVLKGHGSNVQSICWDSSGEHLISVCEDSVKVWRMDSVGKANCIHELSVTGKRFLCGAFHPCYPSLVIIGCYQSMEIWNMTENKLMMPTEEPVSALAVSTMSGLIASAGHNDNSVKLWK